VNKARQAKRDRQALRGQLVKPVLQVLRELRELQAQQGQQDQQAPRARRGRPARLGLPGPQDHKEQQE